MVSPYEAPNFVADAETNAILQAESAMKALTRVGQALGKIGTEQGRGIVSALHAAVIELEDNIPAEAVLDNPGQTETEAV